MSTCIDAAGSLRQVPCPNLLLGMTWTNCHTPRIVNASQNMFCAKTLISLCGASVGRFCYHINNAEIPSAHARGIRS